MTAYKSTDNKTVRDDLIALLMGYERCNTCGVRGSHARGCTQLHRDIEAARRLQATIDERKESIANDTN